MGETPTEGSDLQSENKLIEKSGGRPPGRGAQGTGESRIRNRRVAFSVWYGAGGGDGNEPFEGWNRTEGVADPDQGILREL